MTPRTTLLLASLGCSLVAASANGGFLGTTILRSEQALDGSPLGDYADGFVVYDVYAIFTNGVPI